MDASAVSTTMTMDDASTSLPDLALFVSTLQAMTASSSSISNLLSTTDIPEYSNGISLLGLKNDLLLSYMHNITLLALARLHGRSMSAASAGAGSGAPEETPAPSAPSSSNRVRKLLVERMVHERVVLEKVKPLEVRLRYQIDKLVKKAENAERQGDAAADDEIGNDPLAFKPNPMGLMNRDGSGSEAEDGDEEGTSRKGASSSGIYRPPRLAPLPYLDDRKGKKVRERPAGNALIRDMATSLTNSASNPYIESTSGLSITPSLASHKANKLADIERYEEENYTRLFLTKKDAKRRRMDEEDIALGGTGSREDLMAGSKGVRGKKSHGFENEFDDLLGTIGKKRKTGAADGYDALRAMRKEKKSAAAGMDNELVNVNGLPSAPAVGSRGSKERKGGRFETAVKRSSRKEQHRKKKA